MLDIIIILSLITFALWWCFQVGEIFGIVHKWGRKLPEKIQKPLYDCAVCMHPWWGTVSYWLIFGDSFKEDWQVWLVSIIAGIGFNAVMIKLWPPDYVEFPDEGK